MLERKSALFYQGSVTISIVEKDPLGSPLGVRAFLRHQIRDLKRKQLTHVNDNKLLPTDNTEYEIMRKK